MGTRGSYARPARPAGRWIAGSRGAASNAGTGSGWRTCTPAVTFTVVAGRRYVLSGFVPINITASSGNAYGYAAIFAAAGPASPGLVAGNYRRFWQTYGPQAVYTAELATAALEGGNTNATLGLPAGVCSAVLAVGSGSYQGANWSQQVAALDVYEYDPPG